MILRFEAEAQPTSAINAPANASETALFTAIIEETVALGATTSFVGQNPF